MRPFIENRAHHRLFSRPVVASKDGGRRIVSQLVDLTDFCKQRPFVPILACLLRHWSQFGSSAFELDSSWGLASLFWQYGGWNCLKASIVEVMLNSCWRSRKSSVEAQGAWPGLVSAGRQAQPTGVGTVRNGSALSSAVRKYPPGNNAVATWMTRLRHSHSHAATKKKILQHCRIYISCVYICHVLPVSLVDDKLRRNKLKMSN